MNITTQGKWTHTPPLRQLLILIVCTSGLGFFLGWLAMFFSTDVGPYVAACTMLMSLIPVCLATMIAKRPGFAALVCIIFCLPVAVLNTPLSIAVCMAVGTELLPEIDPHLYFFSNVLGAMYAAPLGVFFGAIYAVPVAATRMFAQDRSHEATDNVACLCGLWTAIVATCLGLPVIALAHLVEPEPATMTCIVLTWAGLTLLGATFFSVGAARIMGRQSWLKKVCKGTVAGVTVKPWADVVCQTEDVRPLFSEKREQSHIVVRQVALHKDGAYRSAGHTVPLATVDAATLRSMEQSIRLSRAPGGRLARAGAALGAALCGF